MPPLSALREKRPHMRPSLPNRFDFAGLLSSFAKGFLSQTFQFLLKNKNIFDIFPKKVSKSLS